MYLSWHGQSCFSLTNKKVSFVLDPYDESKAGIKLPDLKVDVVTFSFPQDKLKNTDSIKVFDWPGEFEVADIPFMGIYSKHPKTDKETIIFKFTVDGINICHLGHLDHVPESQVIDRVGKIDLLIAPAGGESTIGPKEASEIIEDMEPSVVVPMMYSIPGLKGANPDLGEFLNKLGFKDQEKMDRIDLKNTSFPAGSVRVIELEPILG
jgi:L-ascorbate metabolism protein UlaG (beta-lactamase superfamily)